MNGKLERKKIAKEKKKERISKLPQAHLRDASPLIAQIYALDVAEWKGTLNGQGRQQRKLLLDRYSSIKRARSAAGLETPELIIFDPEAHEAQAMKSKIERNVKQSTNSQVLNSSEPKNNQSNHSNYTTEQKNTLSSPLPPLPEGDSPTNEELEALGLPAYQVNFSALESELMEVYNCVEEYMEESVDDCE